MHFGADNPTTRTLVAWLFEVPWLIVLAFFGLRAYRKQCRVPGRGGGNQRPRAVAGPGGSTCTTTAGAPSTTRQPNRDQVYEGLTGPPIC